MATKKPENKYIDRLKRLLPSPPVPRVIVGPDGTPVWEKPNDALPRLYYMKNNNPYIAGIFDSWFSGEAGDCWIEFKYEPVMPVRRILVPDLSPLQVAWGRGRHHEGRNVFVVVGHESSGLLLTEPDDWTKAFAPEEFRSRLIPNSEIADYIMQQCLKEDTRRAFTNSRGKKK